MSDRTILSVTGADREAFLQGLVTNDVTRAAGDIIYTALLTPQGKFIADFFVIGEPDRYLIDVDAKVAPMLAQKLNMYRLRADVQITPIDLDVSRGTGPAPDGAFADPRHADLGWRSYGGTNESDSTDWDALRIANLVPATGIELTPDSYILEMGFERLNGVDFRKGCYVGQEIVARMKHKTDLRKGLARVKLSAPAAAGATIVAAGKTVGTLHTVVGRDGLAYLRFDRATVDMTADGIAVELVE